MVLSIGTWALCILALAIAAYEMIFALFSGVALHAMFGLSRTARPAAFWLAVTALVLVNLCLAYLVIFSAIDNRLTIR
jgi:hypothetical protein